jgi:ribosome biogenesis protein MAK21
MSKDGGDVGKVAWLRIRCVVISGGKICDDAHAFYHKVFFQRYFAQKHGKEQVKAAKVDKRKTKYHDSDTKSDGAIEGGASDEDSDPEEEVIWKVGSDWKMCDLVLDWLMESVQAMKASMPKAEGDDNDDDEDDDDSRVESSIHDSDPDEHVSSDTEEEDQEELSSDAEDDDGVDWEFDGVGMSSSTDAEDADDSVIPISFDSWYKHDLQRVNEQVGSATKEEKEPPPALSGGKKRKLGGSGNGDERRSRKKKLRALPTFASYEEYARMIEDGPEENI